MPYVVLANADGCDGFAVVKKGETTPVEGGCHPSRTKAMAHMAALNMATADEERSVTIYNYGTITITESEVEMEEEDESESEDGSESDSESEDDSEDDLYESPNEEMRAKPNLVAPAFMKASARRGLALHEEGESGDGLKPATVADARRMANGEALSEDKWRRIAPWIARHIVDLDAVGAGEITAGLVAMLLWGGGSSKASARRTQAYAERIVAQLDNEKRNQTESSMMGQP